MQFTSPLKSNSIKIMLLGSGELGREVAIEAIRLGVEVIAVDRYENTPASQVASRSYVIDMQDKDILLEVIKREKPDFILPEIEAISIDALFEAEGAGYHIIPNANAVNKTMNRKNIRLFASRDLGIKTSHYEFVTTLDGLKEASQSIGFPCVIKPVMSSSGYGQSIAKSIDDIESSWREAKEARGDASEVIVEEFVEFDYEITLLTVKNDTTTIFCDPIGHEQKDGDYIFSWQPMAMSRVVLQKAQDIAKKITDGLGGRGIFGVELFVKGDEVYFSEVSPRPHDTGMVTMITQSQSEFALHLRAVLNLPLDFTTYDIGASAAFKATKDSCSPSLNVDDTLFSSNSYVRVFGKPNSHKGRRMALLLTSGQDALKRAKEMIKRIRD
jgi:phosphoribosylglycinamide formyltransferase 2